MHDSKLIVGYDSSDDACVYLVNNDIAVIETVDFFTPIVDDPYQFGQIAAANALSDVYAMGGVPRIAMNLLCVPNCLSPGTIRLILEGGHDKAKEADCVIAGGHTIQDSEPKYGLSVTGFVHPDKILRNIGARPGDLLILTKPIGSGILSTGLKGELVSDEDYASMIGHMSRLNKFAAEDIAAVGGVHACTDITGFGLLGHSYEMASGSSVTICLDSKALPVMSGAFTLAEMGIIPAGAYRNAEYFGKHLRIAEGVEQVYMDLISDPQTSGGLLVSIDESHAEGLLERLRTHSPWSCIVGYVSETTGKSVILE